MELHRSPISACSSKFQLSKFRGRLMGAQLTRFWFTFPERMFLPLSLLSRWFFFFFRKRGQKYSGTNQSRQSGTLPGNVIVLDTLCRSSPMLLASSRQPLLSQYSSSHFISMVRSIFVIIFKLSLIWTNLIFWTHMIRKLFMKVGKILDILSEETKRHDTNKSF